MDDGGDATPEMGVGGTSLDAPGREGYIRAVGGIPPREGLNSRERSLEWQIFLRSTDCSWRRA